MATPPTATATAHPQPTGAREAVLTKPTPAQAGQAADNRLAPQKGPPFVITEMSDRHKYFKGLVYADYGVGKTALWGTAADVPCMRDVLLVSAESGDLTLDDDFHDFRLIDTVRVTNYATVARIYDYLKAHASFRDIGTPESEVKLRELQSRVMPDLNEASRTRHYQTVIIDSLTEVESYCMAQLTGVESAKIDDEGTAPEWSEYRKQHQMVQRLIRNFRDLPMHILFTCARGYVTDELKRHLYSPMMTGKLSSQIQGFMDLVGYMIIGSPPEDGGPAPRRLNVQPNPRYAAKNRFSRFRGNYFDDPSVGGVLLQVGVLKEEEVPKNRRNWNPPLPQQPTTTRK